jgi:hypothetical protein
MDLHDRKPLSGCPFEQGFDRLGEPGHVSARSLRIATRVHIVNLTHEQAVSAFTGAIATE